MSCCAYNCTNRLAKKQTGITFHKFPVNEEIRSLWINAVRRKDWLPTQYSRLCSAHFLENCFDRSMTRVLLRKDAVPTIFQGFPAYLQNVKPPRKEPARRLQVPSVPAQQTPVPAEPPPPHPSQHFDDLQPTEESHTTIKSPSKEFYKRKLQDLKAKCRKKMKVLQQKTRRQQKKIANLNCVITTLKKKRFLNDDMLEVLGKVTGPNKEFLKRQLSKVSDVKQPRKYSTELKAFALTLHYFSPRAYNYVRKVFQTCLPHPRTISQWYSKIDGSPGYTAEALKALSSMVDSSEHHIVCTLVIDEMAIRKHVEWDGFKFHGYVDTGVDMEDDGLPIAREALVFLVVAVNGSWKIPVGYFLTDGINSEQRANLVIQCLQLLHKTGVIVVALTFDGLAANINMAKELGCSFEPRNFKTTFPHPIDHKEIAVFLDPCHMLKLIRNTLGEKSIIFNGNGEMIEWRYVAELQKLQEGEGLNLGNKLKTTHIKYYKQKMKVRLAAQLFSASVANAIEYCDSNLQLPQFKGSEVTVQFIRLMNNLFDILNSRSFKQYGLKKPLNPGNENQVLPFLEEAFSYITNLTTTSNGPTMLNSCRKTGFLGFLICINSLKCLYSELVKKSGPILKYLPMYKMSQDHIELFFSAVRSHGGCNNNPTARQFRVAYKKLLIRSEIRGATNGNCLPLEDLSILGVSSSASAITLLNASSEKFRLLNDTEYEKGASNHVDHTYLPQPCHLSECSERIIEYIAGYVVRALSKQLVCEHCVEALICLPEGNAENSLIAQKDRGGLTYPSKDVQSICKRSEQFFRAAVNSGSNKTLIGFHTSSISNSVLKYFVGKDIFSSLNQHMHDMSPLNNHIVYLTKAVSEKYVSIRFNYFAKNIIETSDSVRNMFTKTILFKGQ